MRVFVFRAGKVLFNWVIASVELQLFMIYKRYLMTIIRKRLHHSIVFQRRDHTCLHCQFHQCTIIEEFSTAPVSHWYNMPVIWYTQQPIAQQALQIKRCSKHFCLLPNLNRQSQRLEGHSDTREHHLKIFSLLDLNVPVAPRARERCQLPVPLACIGSAANSTLESVKQATTTLLPPIAG